MGPVSRAATVQFQQAIVNALRDLVREQRETRELINNRMGGNALDHETINERINATERRIYEAEQDIRHLKQS